MKIKGISFLALVFALSSVAAAETPTMARLAPADPANCNKAEFTENYEFTKAEKAIVDKMHRMIVASKAKGALDAQTMKDIFASAYTAKVSPCVIGHMVADLVRSFPDAVAPISVAALTPANGAPSNELVWHVMNAAVLSSPRPFAAVLPVRNAVMGTIDSSKAPGMAAYVNSSAIKIASVTADNPVNGTAVTIPGLKGQEQQGAETGVGKGGLFYAADVGLYPFIGNPQPVSSPGGSSANQ